MRKFDRYWFRKGEDLKDLMPYLMYDACRAAGNGNIVGGTSLMRRLMYEETEPVSVHFTVPSFSRYGSTRFIEQLP